MRPTLLLRGYALITRFILPFVARAETRKLKQHGTPQQRWKEKTGYASIPQPNGPLIWFHAASVGETLSVLGLIEALSARMTGHYFLITSGTPTSADLVAKRLPPRTQHQFAPLDAPQAVGRFLEFWQPEALVFVESELWPNMISAAARHGIPTALINARMSDKTLEGWNKRSKSAEALLSNFKLIETQTEDLADALRTLGATPDTTHRGPNLKAHSAPLPQDSALVDQLQATIGGRPIWVAASTHPGEEKIALDAHKSLLDQNPGLHLILAPRHPDRGDEVAKLISHYGWSAPRRSLNQLPDDGPVYLLDTLGDLGNFYPLADFVFMGGSFSKMGGHNPFEAVQFGVPVITGPDIRNFSDAYGELVGHGAARIAPAPDRLDEYAGAWLVDPAKLETAAEAEAQVAAAQAQVLNSLADRLTDHLSLDRKTA